ncbi:MAG: hypothetical protein P1S46_06225 [bacterium]|nr:hypothetical protein [bacterium]
MIYVGLWMVAAFISAIVANNKNRSGVLWFFFTILFAPLVLVALVMPKVEKKVAQTTQTGEASREVVVETVEGGKVVTVRMPAEIKCPMCAEIIKGEALKCRFCGHDLSEWREEYIEKNKDSLILIDHGHENLDPDNMLRTADYHNSNGNSQKAAAYYRLILQKYPETEHAEIAQKSLSG